MNIKLKRSDYVGFFVMTDVQGNFIAMVSDTIIDDDNSEIIRRIIIGGEEVCFALTETKDIG